ncbi:MAG TPA: hypothetical protein PK307_16200 [Spirochaetota bacterium]|nr:hypothetical protein [Spirochaetota bacterium]HOD14144.1 hypothetical protein [Spirochaetota bacterium]HPG49189.1 hypothetical protein [Spirochaetota bacterium]HPN10759.1 hypothetical protein [Spirochaetota bacterium]HQL83743.1 hypothetical protein [Spirochaetota bacterium]
MIDGLLIKSVFLFIIFWGIGIGMLWFRPRIEIVWKIIATIILVFYIWFFFDEISSGYAAFSAGWYNFVVNFLKELISLVYVNLFFIWPVALILIFYKADAIGAERLLRFLCVLTLVIWIVFIVYDFFNRGIDDFMINKLKEMVPGAK